MPLIIFIRDLLLETVIGVHDDERRAPAAVILDLEIELPHERAASSDRLIDTVDYGEVILAIRQNLDAGRHRLLEHLAGSVADLIIARFGARRVKVSIAKPGIFKDAGHVGIVLERLKLQP
jgi:dihydroneopterin aldolase